MHNAPGHAGHAPANAKPADGEKSAKEKKVGDTSMDARLTALKEKYDAANTHLKDVIARKQAVHADVKADPENVDLKAKYDNLKAEHTKALERIRADREAYKTEKAKITGTAAG